MGEEITPQQALRQIPPTTIASVDSNVSTAGNISPIATLTIRWT